MPLTGAHIIESCVKRRDRIAEAIAWPRGPAFADQVDKLIWEKRPYSVVLSKPGKEVFRKERPNANDMTPNVRTEGVDAKAISFGEILGEIMGIHPHSGAGELLGALLVRSAFMADHLKNRDGHWRYHPSQEVIDAISAQVPNPYGVSVEAFLHYLDVLGWNEDVKYYTLADKQGRRYLPDKGWKYGRENTFLTCANFVAAHLGLVSWPTLMDNVIRGRGICPISLPNAFKAFPSLGPAVPLPQRRKTLFAPIP